MAAASAFRQITCRRLAQRLAEHGDEGARALIAEIERHGLDRRALVEALKRDEDVKLLAPAAKAHAGLALQDAGEGSRGDGACAGPSRRSSRGRRDRPSSRWRSGAALASTGIGKRSSSTGAADSWSSSTVAIRPSAPSTSYMTGMWVACTSRRSSNGEIDSVQHCLGSAGLHPARRTGRYTSTSPTTVTLCGTVPGIDTAQRGGTIQTPCPASQPDDAPQGQDKLVLAMRVHGQLHALRDHVTAEGGEGAWHGLGVEIPESSGRIWSSLSRKKGIGR